MPRAMITASAPFSLKELAVNGPVWNLGKGWQSLGEPGRKHEPVSQVGKLEMWRTGKDYRKKSKDRKGSIREAGQSPGCSRGGKIHKRPRDQEGQRQRSLLKSTEGAEFQ